MADSTHERDSLVAQMVKNLPAMRETWVQSQSWKDPLEKGMTTLHHYFCILYLQAWGPQKLDTTEELTLSTHYTWASSDGQNQNQTDYICTTSSLSFIVLLF